VKKIKSDIGSFFTLCHCLFSKKKRRETLQQQIREAVEDAFQARWAYEGWRQHFLLMWQAIGQQYFLDCRVEELEKRCYELRYDIDRVE